MSWNLRLIRHVDRKSKDVWYGVHEMFYTESGKPWAMTKNPTDVMGDTPEEVHRYVEMIRHDLKRMPILDANKIKWARELDDNPKLKLRPIKLGSKRKPKGR